MKLFRLKFVLLGLFLFVCNVWSLNCGTEYNDAASNAYLSDVVVVGRVSQKLPLGYEKYKATIRIQGKRGIFKGATLLKKGSSRKRSSDMITIGIFQDVQEDSDTVPGVGECGYSLTRDIQYLFFLNSTSQKKYYSVTAMPISEHLKREFKRGKKDIKKILCKSGNCVTPPISDSRRGMKDASIQFGKALELNCKLKKRTFPITKFIWLKDGEDITLKSKKGFSIKDNKKGSVLRIRKTGLSDNGTYECVAKNVAGEIRQQAVISITGVNAPQAGSGSMKDKKQKFKGTLKLTCKIKKGALPKAEFFWYKDGKLITSGYKRGLTIRSRATQSRLRKKPVLQSDAGVYLCKAKNAYGEINQTSKVTVINETKTPAPQRIVPCGERDKHWCMNNGTCSMYVELKQKYCTCVPGYGGDRCMELMFDKTREEKLAQDRNLVIVGIISGIILFIGICVASYFLAKRRREQFYRRRGQRNNGNIEDNIPQIYRPLIGCDDIDGLKKQMAGFGIAKGTQTIETCFIGNDRENVRLYVNPMTGYQKGKNERKPAVSLESAPRPTYNGSNESLDKPKPEHPESNSDNNAKSNPESKRNSINNSASDGGPSEIFKLMNDLNPKKKSAGADSPKNTGANKPNIPTTASPTSTKPPAFNLDTDSDDEILNDVTPLTPLHISEDEDNNSEFKKIRPKTTVDNTGNNQTKKLNEPPRGNSSNKNDAKSKPYQARQPPPQLQSKSPQQHQQPPKQPKPNQQLQPNQQQQPKQKPQPKQQHAANFQQPKQQHQPKQQQQQQQQSNQQSRPHQQQHPPKQQQQQPLLKAHAQTKQEQPQAKQQPRQPSQQQGSRQPRSDNKQPLKQNEARASPGDKLYASTSSSGYSDSDSSTTTEGCDSPNTAFMNSQDLSEPAPAEPGNQWNERGSPEPRISKASSRYKPPPDIGVGREQYYSTSGASPGRKGAGVRDYGRNFRQSR